MLTGQRLEANQVITIDANELKREWSELKTRYPWFVEASRSQQWEFHFRQARECKRAGLHERALAHLEATLTFGPDLTGMIHSQRGHELTTLGRHKDAEEAFRSALELQPANNVWRQFLANAFYRQGKMRDAADAYGTVISEAPERQHSYQWSGHANGYLGSWQQTAERFRESAARRNATDVGGLLRDRLCQAYALLAEDKTDNSTRYRQLRVETLKSVRRRLAQPFSDN